jgi:hypothetical protein
MFQDNPRLEMTDEKITYCYGMSKMTIPAENDKGERKYNELRFVEFLEFLGRIADVRFRNSELEIIPLDRKLEFVLDDIFSFFGITRKSIASGLSEETASDSDY